MSQRKSRQAYEFVRGLYRDRENAWVFGVCAGIAEYGDFPVGIVRLIAVISLWFFTAATVIAYLAAALLFRNKPLTYSGPYAERDLWKNANLRNEWRHE